MKQYRGDRRPGRSARALGTAMSAANRCRSRSRHGSRYRCWAVCALVLVAYPVMAPGAEPQRTYAAAYDAYHSGDLATARKRFKRLARRGDTDAQYALGVLAYTDQTDTADPARALRWFRKAARGGNAAAAFNVGVARWTGSGVARDRAKAVSWWQRAAAQGDAAASYNLGVAYYAGEGTAMDPAQAARWLQQAVALGHRDADAALGQVRSEYPDLALMEPAPVAPSPLAPSPSAHAAVQVAPIHRPDPISLSRPLPTVNPVSGESAAADTRPDTSTHSETSGVDTTIPQRVAVVATARPAQEVPAATVSRNRVGSTGTPVYALADSSSPGVAELDAGTPLRVVEKRGPWGRVEAPGGFLLWAHSSYIERIGDVGRIRIDNLNARPRPSVGSGAPPLGRLLKDDAVPVADQRGEWLLIRAPETIGAWVPLRNVESVEVADTQWDQQWQQWTRRRVAAAATGSE